MDKLTNAQVLSTVHTATVGVCLTGWKLGLLVGLYGIPTFVGYLIPNPVYTIILNVYDLLTNSSWVTF